MPQKMKRMFLILGVLLAVELIAVLGIVGYWRPYRNAISTMPEGENMTLVCQQDGALALFWPEGYKQDRYLVEVKNGEESLFKQWTVEPACLLPELPQGELLQIQVSTAGIYKFPLGFRERIRMGEKSLTGEVDLTPPAVGDLTWTPDPESRTVQITFTLAENTQGRIYDVDSSGYCTEREILEEGNVTLSFGENGDYPMPAEGERRIVAFDAQRFCPGLVYRGTITEQVRIVREDLLKRELDLECTDEGNHVYTLTWGETKGDFYEVQQLDKESGTWATLVQLQPDEERSYTTPHLDRYSEYSYRVVSVGGQTMEDSEYAAISEEITVTTGASVVYSTIWPIQELDIYADVDKTQVIGKATAAKAYCVLDARDGMFQIRHEEAFGYIDSNYCLINLPDYLGDLCVYDITNSERSLLTVHEYELPGFTGRVVPGYERVQLRRGQQLVPLLYPVAQRLETAAQKAKEQGYRLKIYDAYRPRKASKALNDLVKKLSDELLPQGTYMGIVPDDLRQLEEGQVYTYKTMMTNFDTTTISSFLEDGKSRQNQGVALDVMLVEINNGGELMMQSYMHDLSWYSSAVHNNANAKKLATIMQSAGFTAQKSMWWSFYDAEAQKNLKPEYQETGVSPEGWVADDEGWRYRRDDGEFYVNREAVVDSITYTFDDRGYVVP